MKMDANDFRKTTREILAKRAQQTCSNPYCPKPTTGPHTDDDRNVDVGEAAHIRGARPGSKRYDTSMQPEERRDITNGIWLCRSCAKLIDSDEKRYSVELLYEWKRNHEASVATLIQGVGWQWSVEKRYLRPFENESPAAYQIAIDKPEYWEYLLTIELLRAKSKNITRSYDELNRGLVFKPSTTLCDKEQVKVWLSEKLNDFNALNSLLVVAAKEELMTAWGIGEPLGDAIEILRAVNKIIYGCEWLLNWEIDVHFTKFPRNFVVIKEMMGGWTSHTLSKMELFLEQPSNVFKVTDEPEGEIHLNIVFQNPENFDEVVTIFKRLWDED